MSGGKEFASIRSREDYLRYLEADRRALGISRPGPASQATRSGGISACCGRSSTSTTANRPGITARAGPCCT